MGILSRKDGNCFQLEIDAEKVRMHSTLKNVLDFLVKQDKPLLEISMKGQQVCQSH